MDYGTIRRRISAGPSDPPTTHVDGGRALHGGLYLGFLPAGSKLTMPPDTTRKMTHERALPTAYPSIVSLETWKRINLVAKWQGNPFSFGIYYIYRVYPKQYVLHVALDVTS